MSQQHEVPKALATRIAEALAGTLPGRQAHELVLPEGRVPATVPEGALISDAAVLLALYRERGPGERIVFPLIRRPDSMLHHAGQIALPGGAQNPDEGIVRCALREANEEIGLDPDLVLVLGTLTPLVIPVSRYRVCAVVAWLTSVPELTPQVREVLEILPADPDQLAREGPREWLERERGGARLRFPAYSVAGRKVWGATAAILSEFLAIWRSAARS